jgi:hypothetical protein
VATDAIDPQPLPTAVSAVTITGTAARQQTLKAVTCTVVASGTDHTYTLVAGDAGLKIKASVTGTGPGGTLEVYATAILGAVKSASTASMLSAARPVSLKTSTGKVLAKTSAVVPAAGGQATVTVTAATGLKGHYRAWACPTAAAGSDWQPCTKPVTLGKKASRLKLAVDAGERVSVVVAKTGK